MCVLIVSMVPFVRHSITIGILSDCMGRQEKNHHSEY